MALVEAGWRLGDRLLVLAAPQLRGDDIAELQDALNQLGFDCGRPDGIFGPATVRALEDFQRNGGLTPDGICGPRHDSHARVAPPSDRLGSRCRVGPRSPDHSRLADHAAHRRRPVRRTELDHPIRDACAAHQRRHGDVDRRVRGRCPGSGRQPIRCPRVRRFRSPSGRTFARSRIMPYRRSSRSVVERLATHDRRRLVLAQSCRHPRCEGCGCPCCVRPACPPCCVRSALYGRPSMPPTPSPRRSSMALTAWTTGRFVHRNLSCPQTFHTACGFVST